MKNKKCISFSCMTYYWFIPLILPLVCSITHYYQKELVLHLAQKDIDLSKYLLPSLVYIFISKIPSIIFWGISIFRSKDVVGQEKLIETNTIRRRYHLKVEESNKPSKILFIIFLISFLEVIFKAEDFYYINNEIKIEKRIFFGILVPILSHYSLKKLHRHQWFGVLISLIGYGFLILEFFLSEGKCNYIINIFHILFTIPFSFSLVLIKYLLNKYFISPYMFLFFDGIFCMINAIITMLLETFLLIRENREKFIIDNFKFLLILRYDKDARFALSMQIIFSFFYYLTNALTIYYFSPTLLVLTDIISPLITKIILLIGNENYNNLLILRFIGYVIIIFGASILNEFIILNFFGLGDNTYINISERSIRDVNELMADLRFDNDESYHDSDSTNEP